MKKYLLIAIQLLFYNIIFSQQPYCNDLVKINGKYFQCGGNIFYPLMVGYVFNIVNNPNPSDTTDYFLSRNVHYGPWHPDGYEGISEQEWRDQIMHDFQKIHQMGFNSIRTNLGPTFAYTPKVGFNEGATFTPNDFVQISDCINCPGWSGTAFIVNTNSSVIDPYRIRLFHFYEEILTIAYSCSLKVILDVGYGPVTDPAHFNDYKNYLTLFGQFIHSLPVNIRNVLIAYAIVEEPQWESQSGPIYNKYYVCDVTTQMYDLLKNVDPEHLITLGGGEPSAIIDWDLSVMKFDFVSPHLYPNPIPGNGYFEPNSVQAVERVKRDIYWLYKNSNVPWIIGETGFMAMKDWFNFWDPVSVTPTVINFPEADGTLLEQKQYAHDILNMVRDCGGAGMLWWEYQEDWQGDFGYGLLEHGEAFDDINNSLEKPLVQEFKTYLNSIGEPPQIITNGCTMPASYYDGYLTKGPNGFNPTNIAELDGTLINANTTDLIEDAYVAALYSPGINNLDGNRIYYTLDTYTTLSGEFNLVPYDWINNYNSAVSYFNEIKLSATKAERAERNTNHTGANPHSIIITPNEQFLLKVNSINNLNISNFYIQGTGSNNNFVGFNQINIDHTSIASTATAQFIARDEINANEFEIKNGSEVILKTENHWPYCDLYDPAVFLRKSNTTMSVNLKYTIELAFKSENPFEVFPNPSTGLIYLHFKNKEIKKIEIYNTIGSNILIQDVENDCSLDLSKYSKGLYFIKISQDNYSSINKLIIN